MKILSSGLRTAAAQVHTGRCYFLGATVQGGKDLKVYNIETSGNAADANMVGYIEESSSTDIYFVPKPGIECSNGIYVTANASYIIYYAI